MIESIFYVLMFLAGAGVLIYSVEELIENISKAAIVSGVSSFFLAVVFAGMDFENWAFGVASVLGEVSGVALGSAFGSAVFLVGVAVAASGYITPFKASAETDYLVLMIASPIIALPFLLDGILSRLDGAILLIVFSLITYYLFEEEKKGRETFRDEETQEALEEIKEEEHTKWFYIGFSAVFVLGIGLGSFLAVQGAKKTILYFGFNETVFGMTAVGLVMALEEILLVVEPVRRGRESIAIGNIIGSLIFFSTGNIGLIALTRGFSLDPSVVSFYWPFLFISTLLIAAFIYNERIKKTEALVLSSLYLAYWILSYTLV